MDQFEKDNIKKMMEKDKEIRNKRLEFRKVRAREKSNILSKQNIGLRRKNKYWKKPVVWLISFISSIFIIIIAYYVLQWLNRPDIKLGASIYVYEKAFILHNQTKTYYKELRNLATNCRIYRFKVGPLACGRAEIPEPGAWILLKLRLENISPVALTNLRLGIRAFSMTILDTVSCTPNIEASMNKEFATNGALSTYVVVIDSLSSHDKAIVTLKGSIDKETYIAITSKQIKIVFPFIVSDQFKAVNLKNIKFNASEMLKDESEMFTGKRLLFYEKVEYRLLSPEEPNIIEEEIHYDPLPPAKKCPEGTGGNW